MPSPQERSLGATSCVNAGNWKKEVLQHWDRIRKLLATLGCKEEAQALHRPALPYRGEVLRQRAATARVAGTAADPLRKKTNTRFQTTPLPIDRRDTFVHSGPP